MMHKTILKKKTLYTMLAICFLQTRLKNLVLLFIAINIFYSISNAQSEAETVTVKIISQKKLAIFSSVNSANYTIEVANGYKETQSGTVSYRLLTEKGEEVNTASTEISIKGKGTKKVKFEVPGPNPGFYGLIVEKYLVEFIPIQ